MTDFSKLLNELMGEERDVLPEERSNRARQFSDRDVCKYYICGFDLDIFKNTKSAEDVSRHVLPEDAGKRKDDDMRAAWEALPDDERAKYPYERETKRLLDRLIFECDRRVARSVARCEQAREVPTRAFTPEEQKVLDKYSEQIKEISARAEALGEEGDVDGAQAELSKIESLQSSRELVLNRLKPQAGLTACTVSGVLLSAQDNESRREEHLHGKQYLGWKRLRELRDELGARLLSYREKRLPGHWDPRDASRGGGGGG